MIKQTVKPLLLTAIMALSLPLNAWNVSHYMHDLLLDSKPEMVVRTTKGNQFVQYSAYPRTKAQSKINLYNDHKKTLPCLSLTSAALGVNSARLGVYRIADAMGNIWKSGKFSLPTFSILGHFSVAGLLLAGAYFLWNNQAFTLLDSMNTTKLNDELIVIEETTGNRITDDLPSEVTGYASNNNVIWIRVKNPTIF